jgi:hypothetical protein
MGKVSRALFIDHARNGQPRRDPSPRAGKAMEGDDSTVPPGLHSSTNTEGSRPNGDAGRSRTIQLLRNGAGVPDISHRIAVARIKSEAITNS